MIFQRMQMVLVSLVREVRLVQSVVVGVTAAGGLIQISKTGSHLLSILLQMATLLKPRTRTEYDRTVSNSVLHLNNSNNILLPIQLLVGLVALLHPAHNR